ncbi:MAG: M28 family peptidase [Pirellulaceae bacterium]|nr:M28 family peptidase [Pirellulaceae bacterium]
MMNDASKLRSDVEAIATSDGRQVGTDGHTRAKKLLLQRLGDLGLDPYLNDSYELPYESSQQSFANLVGVVPGTDPTRDPILIGAHYDSVIPSYCADDNAAAVAITLLAAEKIKPLQLDRDLVIALFDAEEPPYFLSEDMGSTRFVREQNRTKKFHAAIIMDLVGHDVELTLPGLEGAATAAAGLLFMTGAESHAALPNVVRHCLPDCELPVVASLNRNVGDMSDHHAFRLDSVPYLFLSCGRWQHYHQISDTPDKLNYDKMANICELVVQLCRRLSTTELPRSEQPATAEQLENGFVDTTQFELELIRGVFGDALDLFLDALEMKSLDSRADLNQLASRLQSFFEI